MVYLVVLPVSTSIRKTKRHRIITRVRKPSRLMHSLLLKKVRPKNVCNLTYKPTRYEKKFLKRMARYVKKIKKQRKKYCSKTMFKPQSKSLFFYLFNCNKFLIIFVKHDRNIIERVVLIKETILGVNSALKSSKD